MFVLQNADFSEKLFLTTPLFNTLFVFVYRKVEKVGYNESVLPHGYERLDWFHDTFGSKYFCLFDFFFFSLGCIMLFVKVCNKFRLPRSWISECIIINSLQIFPGFAWVYKQLVYSNSHGVIIFLCCSEWENKWHHICMQWPNCPDQCSYQHRLIND